MKQLTQEEWAIVLDAARNNPNRLEYRVTVLARLKGRTQKELIEMKILEKLSPKDQATFDANYHWKNANTAIRERREPTRNDPKANIIEHDAPAEPEPWGTGRHAEIEQAITQSIEQATPEEQEKLRRESEEQK